MSNITIQSDVPVPTQANKPGVSIYPFADMQPGDSFFVEGIQAGSRAAVAARKRACLSKTTLSYASRKVTEDGHVGFRIWRLR
jgi:hypothetical protein